VEVYFADDVVWISRAADIVRHPTQPTVLSIQRFISVRENRQKHER
jgi:hypothetical protein